MRRESRNRRAAVSSGVGIAQRLVQVVCTLILMPVLLHALGITAFGIWGAAASLAWVAHLADLGAGSALVTFVAHSTALGQPHEARRQIEAVLTISSALALTFLLLIFAVWYGHPWDATGTVYVIALAGLAINLPLNSATNIWSALQEGYYASAWELVQTLLTTTALLVATLYTRDVRVFVAIVYGGLIAANLGSLTHLWIIHPELRPHRLPARWAAARDLVSSGILFFLMGLAGSLNYMLDNVLALEWLGPHAAAQMTIALRVCMTGMGLLAVISQPLWPAFTDAAHTADREWVMHKLIWGMILLTAIAAAGSFVLVFWGESLLHLWLHRNLGIGLVLLVAIAAWVIAFALARVPNLLMNGLLLVRYRVVVATIALAAAFALKFLLAAKLGVAGILWGTTVSVLLIIFPAILWRIWQWSRTSPNPESIA